MINEETFAAGYFEGYNDGIKHGKTARAILRAENEKLRAERDLWISRFEDFRKNAARIEEARLKPMRLVGSAAAAALKETGDE